MTTVLTPPMSRVRWQRWLKVVICVALWGLITHGSPAGTGDEPHYLAIAHSIAFDGDLDVANNYGSREPLIAGGALAPENHVRVMEDGVMRPVHDIGMPLLFAPVSRVFVPIVHRATRTIPPGVLQRARLTPSVLYRHLLSLVMIALTALLADLIFDALIRSGATMKEAFGATLVVVLSPPMLLHATLFFTELLSALLCFAVFRRLVWAQPSSAAGWLVTGAAAGFLMLVHARNAGLVMALSGLGLAAAWRIGSRRSMAAFAGGVALLLAIRTAVNYHFWGTFVTNSHATVGTWPGWPALFRESGTRLAGLLVDQEFGLLVYAPIYLVAIVGLAVMMIRDRGAAVPIVLVVVAYLVLIVCPLTNVHGWTGGWSPAARFLVPILPLFAVPLAAGFRRVPAVVLVPVLAVQIGIDAALWQYPRRAWNDGDGRAAFCPYLPICDYLPSLSARETPSAD